MNKRRFISTLTALALAPWNLLFKASTPKLVRGFPDFRNNDFKGWIAKDIRSEDFWMIESRMPDEFMWHGQWINNYRQNKWKGYNLNDRLRVPVLLVLDDALDIVEFYKYEFA